MANLPVFRTWVAGEVVTAAYFNSNVRDAGNFFLSWPVAEIRQTVAQSFPNITQNALTLDTNDIDTDGGHSTSVNPTRYTGKTPGRFQGSGMVSFVSNATGRRLCLWIKNGTTSVNSGQAGAQTITSGNGTQVPARTVTTFLNGTTDYIELQAYQDSTVALNTDVSVVAVQPGMSVRMVGTT